MSSAEALKSRIVDMQDGEDEKEEIISEIQKLTEKADFASLNIKE